MTSPSIPIEAEVRDEAIIDHVDRNRITLRLVLEMLFFAHCKKTRNAITQVTSRLCKEGSLNRYKLLANSFYFTLGPCAVRKNPARRMSQTKRLPPARLPIELGSLEYCCLTGVVRKRLLPQEVARAYPQLPKELRWQHPYYIDHDGDTRRLAMVRVELSGSAGFIIAKHKKNFYQYGAHPGLRSMLDQGQLMIVVVSPNKDVLSRFAELLEGDPFYPPCRLFECPDLWNFIPRGK